MVQSQFRIWNSSLFDGGNKEIAVSPFQAITRLFQIVSTQWKMISQRAVGKWWLRYWPCPVGWPSWDRWWPYDHFCYRHHHHLVFHHQRPPPTSMIFDPHFLVLSSFLHKNMLGNSVHILCSVHIFLFITLVLLGEINVITTCHATTAAAIFNCQQLLRLK